MAIRKTKTDRPWKRKSGKRRPRAGRTSEQPSVVVKPEHDEAASSEIREPLTTELDVLQRLHALSMELISGGEIDAFFERMLDTAVAIMDSDGASMQMLHPFDGDPTHSGQLRLLAWRGFHPESARFWEWITLDSLTACGNVLRNGDQYRFGDVETSELLAGTADLREFRRSGIRAIQSMPLRSRSGQLVGVISTHWRRPYEPPPGKVKMMELLARQAADLIEHRRAEEKLRRLNEELEHRVMQRTQDVHRLATLVETAHDAIYTRTFGGAILSWNVGAERLYGYTAEEMIGRSCLVLIPPDRQAELEDKHAALVRGEPVAPFETMRLRKDGRTVDVSLSISAIRDGAGEVLDIAVIGRDVTDRKQADQLLAQRAAQQAAVATLGQKALAASSIQRLMDDAVEIVCDTLDTDFCKVLELLPGGKKLLLRAGIGWSEGLVGHATVETAHGSQAGYTLYCAKPVVVSDLRTESRFRGPALLLDHGIISGISCIIAGRKGQPYGVLGAHTKRQREFSQEDIAFLQSIANIVGSAIQRGKAAQALERSEARMRAVLDTAVDAIITIDQRGVIGTVNPATERMFQYAKEELIGQNVKILMPPPYADEHVDYIRRYLETGTARIIGIGREVIGRRKDGTMFPVDLAVSELKQLGLFTGVIRDISRRKELEKQVLDAATDEQRRIGQDIHDGLGQELAGLRYMAQTHGESLAQQHSPDAKTAQRISEWLETLQRQLRWIIRDLVPVEVDGDGFITALRDLCKRASDFDRLACEFECMEAVAVDDPALATHLYRIAQEAVHNAVRHAQASRIIVRLAGDNDMLRLQVADDGVGISPERDGNSGIGIPSMAYRAGLIGAHLRIDGAEQGGTAVTCIAPKRRSGGIRSES